MEHIYIKARAKINIALDITKKRLDGYHEVDMIMQTLNLYDGLFIKKLDKPIIKLITNCKWLPTDDKNLVYRAAKILMDNYNINSGVFIELTKNIPGCAGLAGGSSDCATTLRAMTTLFNLTIPNKDMMAIAKDLGADVPYCLMRGTARAKGIGEILTPLPPHPDVTVLLVKPIVKVSTGDVFKKFSFDAVSKRPDFEEIIKGLNEGSPQKISKEFCNVLESVTQRDHPVIGDIKTVMMDNYAMGAAMTGSGPTVFGYFNNEDQASLAIKDLRKRLPISHEVFLTSIYNPNRRGAPKDTSFRISEH